MVRVDVVSPENEDGTTATVLRWLKQPGDAVALHEPLLELETDKVTVEVAAPSAGRLAEILAAERESIEPGAVLGRIEFQDADASSGLASPTASLTPSSIPPPPQTRPPPASRASTATAGASLLSPAVRRMAAEKGIDLGDVTGSGTGGRVTARDLESLSPAAKLVPHSAMRRRIATRVSESIATAPHVTSVFEVDLTQAMQHRDANARDFAARGTKLTLTAYFIAAAATALRAVPEINASYREEALELHPTCNIGVGTALQDEGLIVPVIHAVETLNLFEVATELQRLTGAARQGSLERKDLSGGTFSISNHGVSGSLLAAPIVIVQPQVAILGVGKVTRRPVVEGEGEAEQLVVRPMCYVTLTIDHRAIDGFQANAFLSVFVHALGQWQHPSQ